MVTNARIFVLVWIFCNVQNILGQNIRFAQDGATRSRRSHLSQTSMSQEPDVHSRFSSNQHHRSSSTPFASSRREPQSRHHGSRSNFGISDTRTDRRISHSSGRPTEIGFRQPGVQDFRPVDSTFSSSRVSRLSSRQPSNIGRPEIVIELNRRRTSADSRIMSNSRASSEFSRRSQITRFRDDLSRDNRRIGLSQSSPPEPFGVNGLSERGRMLDSGRNINTPRIFNDHGNAFDNTADRLMDNRVDLRTSISDVGAGSHTRVSDGRLTNHGNSLPGITKLTTDNNAVSLLTELLKGLNSNLKADRPKPTSSPTVQKWPPMKVETSEAPSPRSNEQIPPQSAARPNIPQSPIGGNTVVIQSHNPASASHQPPVMHSQSVINQNPPNIAHGFGHMFQREMADAPELEEILMRKLLTNINSPGFSL